MAAIRNGGLNAEAFVAKYDGDGNHLWTQQFGTDSGDVAWGVATDGLGGVYVGGDTGGPLFGGAYQGGGDGFLNRYDGNGNLIWSRQFGTPYSDAVKSVSADSLGNVFVAGFTLGSYAGPNLGGADAFVTKYDADGNFVWFRQIGTNKDDYAQGVAADGLGNAYVTGLVRGNLVRPVQGVGDAILAKYDSAGNNLWTRQFGSSENDVGQAVAADKFGRVYVSGDGGDDYTFPASPYNDAFASKFDASGQMLGSWQFGSLSYEEGSGVAVDGLGNFYVGGRTGDDIGGPSAGNYDAYIAKFSDRPVPEPSAALMMALGVALLVPRRLVSRAGATAGLPSSAFTPRLGCRKS